MYEKIHESELSEVSGSALTVSAILAYLVLGGGIAAILKILSSSSGRLKIPGLEMVWGR